MDNNPLQHGAISWFELMTKVTERGGKVIVPPTDIPHIGRFSVFSDPQGAFTSAITCFPRVNLPNIFLDTIQNTYD